MKLKYFLTALLMPMLFLAGCSNVDAKGNDITETSSETQTETIQRKVYKVDTTKKLIALTFDDGPNTTTTVEVLDVLQKYEIPASFFLVGNNINEETANVVKRAYEMGCDIQNHSKTHSDMTKLTAEDILAEIDFTSNEIEKIVGVKPSYFRPPYIAVNDTMLENIKLPFICGFGANDWDDAVTAETRAEKIISQSCDGGIILLHDMQGNSKTVEALDTIIPTLIADNYQFVTISELFNSRNVDGMENRFIFSNVMQKNTY